MQLREGTWIHQRYRLLSPIGEGGQAVIWEAEQLGLEGFRKIVALKLVKPEADQPQKARQMLIAEARLVAQIRHPHIVEIFDVGEADDCVYIAMERIHGLDLDQLLRRYLAHHQTPLPWSIAVRLIADACKGLYAAHTFQDSKDQPIRLVHRDLKPRNLLLDQHGYLKIIDFGIAKAPDAAGATIQNILKGTPAFMSPEQIQGATIDARSDLFSIGVILFSLCCGSLPFPGRDPIPVLLHITTRPPLLPRSLRPDLPKKLEEIILRLLEKRPEDRFSDAKAAQKALESLLREDGLHLDHDDLSEVFRHLPPLSSIPPSSDGLPSLLLDKEEMYTTLLEIREHSNLPDLPLQDSDELSLLPTPVDGSELPLQDSAEIPRSQAFSSISSQHSDAFSAPLPSLSPLSPLTLLSSPAPSTPSTVRAPVITPPPVASQTPTLRIPMPESPPPQAPSSPSVIPSPPVSPPFVAPQKPAASPPFVAPQKPAASPPSVAPQKPAASPPPSKSAGTFAPSTPSAVPPLPPLSPRELSPSSPRLTPIPLLPELSALFSSMSSPSLSAFRLPSLLPERPEISTPLTPLVPPASPPTLEGSKDNEALSKESPEEVEAVEPTTISAPPPPPALQASLPEAATLQANALQAEKPLEAATEGFPPAQDTLWLGMQSSSSNESHSDLSASSAASFGKKASPPPWPEDALEKQPSLETSEFSFPSAQDSSAPQPKEEAPKALSEKPSLKREDAKDPDTMLPRGEEASFPSDPITEEKVLPSQKSAEPPEVEAKPLPQTEALRGISPPLETEPFPRAASPSEVASPPEVASSPRIAPPFGAASSLEIASSAIVVQPSFLLPPLPTESFEAFQRSSLPASSPKSLLLPPSEGLDPKNQGTSSASETLKTAGVSSPSETLKTAGVFALEGPHKILPSALEPSLDSAFVSDLASALGSSLAPSLAGEAAIPSEIGEETSEAPSAFLRASGMKDTLSDNDLNPAILEFALEVHKRNQAALDQAAPAENKLSPQTEAFLQPVESPKFRGKTPTSSAPLFASEPRFSPILPEDIEPTPLFAPKSDSFASLPSNLAMPSARSPHSTVSEVFVPSAVLPFRAEAPNQARHATTQTPPRRPAKPSRAPEMLSHEGVSWQRIGIDENQRSSILRAYGLLLGGLLVLLLLGGGLGTWYFFFRHSGTEEPPTDSDSSGTLVPLRPVFRPSLSPLRPSPTDLSPQAPPRAGSPQLSALPHPEEPSNRPKLPRSTEAVPPSERPNPPIQPIPPEERREGQTSLSPTEEPRPIQPIQPVPPESREKRPPSRREPQRRPSPRPSKAIESERPSPPSPRPSRRPLFEKYTLRFQIHPSCELYDGRKRLGSSENVTLSRLQRAFRFSCKNTSFGWRIPLQGKAPAEKTVVLKTGTLSVYTSSWAEIHLPTFGKIGISGQPIPLLPGPYKILLYPLGDDKDAKIKKVMIQAGQTTSLRLD